MAQRYSELDSIRGLAAFTVSNHHFLLLFPAIYTASYGFTSDRLIYLLKFTPLHIIWAGSEAVVLFFVLSGFVLSIQFFEGANLSAYYVKRIFRIYFPYFVTMLVAIVARSLFSTGVISGFSAWFNQSWASPISLDLILQHFSLITSFYNVQLDPVIWSLVQEMRISLIFPLLMVFVIKKSWKKNLELALFLSILSVIFTILSIINGWDNDYFLTLHYSSMFIIGALLAKNRQELIPFVRKIKTVYKMLLLLAGVLCYTISWWMFNPIRIIGAIIEIFDWGIMIGAVIFILLALSSARISKFLLLKPISFLGKISYSYYLYHAVCLLSLVYLLSNVISIWMIYPIYIILSIATAALSYYLVEKPSILFGKLLADKIKGSRIALSQVREK